MPGFGNGVGYGIEKPVTTGFPVVGLVGHYISTKDLLPEGGGVLQSWDDQANVMGIFTVTEGLPSVITGGPNGHPYVEIAAANQTAEVVGNFAEAGDFTVLAVWKDDPNSNSAFDSSVFRAKANLDDESLRSSRNGDLATWDGAAHTCTVGNPVPVPTPNWTLATWFRESGLLGGRVDGVDHSSGTAWAVATNWGSIGNLPSLNQLTDIAALMFYNRKLPLNELVAAESYLDNIYKVI